MQEINFRDRNLKFAEVMLNAKLLSTIVDLLQSLVIETVRANKEVTLNENHAKQAKKDVTEMTTSLMQAFEAELYQEAYLPDYQRTISETLRRKKQITTEQRDMELRALQKVAKFSE